MVLLIAKISLLLILVLEAKFVISSPNFIKNSAATTTALRNLLTTFVSEKFEHCTLVFVFNEDDHEFMEETYDILQSVAKISPQGIFIRKLIPFVEKISIKFPPAYYDVHKIRSNCVLSIFTLHQLSEYYLRLTFHLIRSFVGIMTKDTAYFILLTHKEILDKLLVTSKLAMKIKYKIAIAPATPQILIKTTCFYCNAGEPQLLDVKLLDNDRKFKPLPFIFSDLIRNFHGKKLRVCQAKGVIWLGEIRFENGEWVAKRGHYYNVLKAAMEKYNFSATYFPSVGGGTGIPFPNGSWSGTIGHVAADECDIGQTTARNRARNQQVGFSFAVTYERITFTFAKPERYLSWKAIIWPLDTNVWLAVVVSFVLVMLSFILMAKFTAAEAYKNSKYRRYRNEKYKNLWKIFEYVFGSIVEQGPIGPTIFPSHSLRLISAIWLVFVMVIGTAYRSKLINFMAFPIMDTPPMDLDELANSDYRLILQTVGGAALQLFSSSTNPSYQKIYQRLELEWDASKCFYTSGQPKTSCIGYEACITYATHRNLTDSHGQVAITTPPNDVMGITTVQLIFEYYAIFREFLDFVIINAHDSGLILKWIAMDIDFVKTERREWEAATNTTRFTYAEVEEGSAPLAIEHLLCCFYLLIVGIIVSVAAFMGEQFFRWKETKGNLVVKLM